MAFSTSKTPKTPRSRGANKGLFEFAKLASSILHQGHRGDEPDSPLSQYAAAIDPRSLRANKEVEVLVLSKLPGVNEQLEKAFGFSHWNVYTGKEPPKEEKKVEIQEPPVEEAPAPVASPAPLTRSNSKSGKTPRGSTSTLNRRASRSAKSEESSEDLTKSFDMGNLAIATRKDQDIADEHYRYRLAVHQHSLTAPYQLQVSLERHGKKQPIAFSLAEDNPEAIKQALRQADVVLAEPGLFNPYISAGQDILWLHSTEPYIESVLDAIEGQRRLVDEKRQEYLRAREKFDAERDAIAAKKAALQARYDQHSPLLRDATERIKGMDKADLDSIRALKNPPKPVALCLGAIVSLLAGTEISDWERVLKVISTPNFKYSILDFDPFVADPEFAKFLHEKYIKHEEFSYDKIERAHAGAGALARWLVAQVELAEASASMKPLMEESKTLKTEFDALGQEIRDFLNRAAALVEVKEVAFHLSRLGGIAGPTSAQYVLAQILANEHKLLSLAQKQQNAEWSLPASAPRLLQNLEVAILGAGDLGSYIAKYLKQFGIKTKALVRTEKAELPAFDQVFATDAKEGTPLVDFLKGADYIVNTLPSTKRTVGLLNGNALQNCNSNAVFINLSRGDVIDEASLSAALDNNWISSVVLDATFPQPLPADSPLWKKPGVVITPGVAYASTTADSINLFVDNLHRYVAHSSLLFKVDLEHGY